GFVVHYLGTQNGVGQLCSAARRADAVLVSNMDGHARVYLRDLASMQAETGVRHKPWYLGGNPAVRVAGEALDDLAALGFDRVFPGYVEPATVIRLLRSDLNLTRTGIGRLVTTRPDARPGRVGSG